MLAPKIIPTVHTIHIIQSLHKAVDQVARMALQKFSTIDSVGNQNPRIVHKNLECRLCHLTQPPYIVM